MKDKLAVIISVYYNDELSHFIEAIESIINQDDVNPDIYLIEDGVIKEEVHNYIIEKYKYGKIKYLLTREENKGLAFSLNELLAIVLNTDYEYIARMDADDICIPKRFYYQIKYLQENPLIDCVGGYIEEFGGSSGVITFPLLSKDMRKYFAYRNPLAHVTVMFRKDFFKKAGFYPTESIRNEDTLLWINGFYYQCNFANIPIILVKVRVDERFIKRRSNLQKIISDIKIRAKAVALLKLNPLYLFLQIPYLFIMILPYFIKRPIIGLLRYRHR